MSNVIKIAVVAALAATAAPAYAQEASGDDWIRSKIGIHAGQQASQIRSQMRRLFVEADADGGGVSAKDHEIAAQIAKAQARAGRIAITLGMDLDGDTKVTRDEIKLVLGKTARRPMNSSGTEVMPTIEQQTEILDRLVVDALKADADKDGLLNLTEMGATAENPLGLDRMFGLQQMIPLSLDTNSDGITTLQEFDAAVEAVIGAADTNGDGSFSDQEAYAFQAIAQEARQATHKAEQTKREVELARAQAAKCQLPKPSEKAEVILIGAYEGASLSNVSLGGDDIEVSAGNLHIDKGDEPLYIVATSHEAMIWHITGATERVERLVLNSGTSTKDKKVPRAGVVGLAKDIVAVVPESNCLPYFYDVKNSQSAKAKTKLKVLIDRDATDVIGGYKIGKVMLPSGIQSPEAMMPLTRILPKSGPGASMWREMLKSTPAGLADFDAATVVSAVPAKAYDVLPQQAGLAQLLDAGVLEASKSSRVLKIGGMTIDGGGGNDVIILGSSKANESVEEYTRPNEFRIVKKTTFPAGLNGGHSVKFILAKGVPMPDGSPGHSTVNSEETGEAVGGRPDKR